MLIFIFIFCVSVVFLVYSRGKLNETYWKKRSVTFHPENRVTGVFWDFIANDRAVFKNLHEIYKRYPNEPAVGIGSFFTPALYVLDPVNVQHVLATDFNSFNHRGFEGNEGDLLAENLLFLNGKKWKLMRQSLTPIFTSAKLKSMFYIMDKSAQDFVKYLEENPISKEGDAFNILSTFCSGAIGAAVFGINTKSIFDSPFLKMAQSASRPSIVKNMQFAVGNLCLPLFKLLGFKLFKEYEGFFIGAIKNVIRQREQEHVKKHDFADLCVALQSNGKLKDADTGVELDPTDELLAAQGFFFFIAGVEPTAASMYAVLLELGRNNNVLQRIHKEIDDAFEKTNGKLTYDAVSDMEYLEMVIYEAMRLHPPIGFLTRQCVQDTVLPVGNIKVSKGTKIFTPIFEIHHDEKYYPDPETFDPERFSKDKRKSGTEAAYMPFGKGNRVCIGMRYAQLQAKMGLIHLLHNFTVKTSIPKIGLTYKKETVQVRINNATVEIVFRNIIKKM